VNQLDRHSGQSHADRTRRDSSRRDEHAPVEVTNIRAVVDMERQTRRERTALERLTDLVSAAVSSTGFILFHFAWFFSWIAFNVAASRRFDPFPFNLLTLVVSLEAIVLTGFVLMSQNRLTQLADRRAHLDLQVNLLAEQELTAILQVVCLVAERTGVTVKGDPDLVKLLARTDVKVLAEELTREMATVDAPPPSMDATDERADAPRAACS
jgi:uncharacterized membrane protein